MYSFSKSSKENLATAHTDLQRIFNRVIKSFDCTVVEGHRGEKEQNLAYDNNKTELIYPLSNHNSQPSMAVDVVPYHSRAIFGRTERERQDMALFAGFVLATASAMFDCNEISMRLRWGGDWNRNNSTQDTNFLDAPHFELIEN